jgi:hypothetical protein
LTTPTFSLDFSIIFGTMPFGLTRARYPIQPLGAAPVAQGGVFGLVRAAAGQPCGFFFAFFFQLPLESTLAKVYQNKGL